MSNPSLTPQSSNGKLQQTLFRSVTPKSSQNLLQQREFSSSGEMLKGDLETSFDESMDYLANAIDSTKLYITGKRTLNAIMDYDVLERNIKNVLRCCHILQAKIHFEAAFKDYSTNKVTLNDKNIDTMQKSYDISNDIAAIGLFLKESDESKSESESEKNQILLAMALKAIKTGRKLRELGLMYKLDLLHRQKLEFERILYELIPGFKEFRNANNRAGLTFQEKEVAKSKWSASKYLQHEYPTIEEHLKAESMKKALSAEVRAYTMVAEEVGTEERAIELTMVAKRRAYNLVWSSFSN
ncbi:unnamed protein product [Ambrosiozyma monospora]|uniref:Unnamed protein product n=1 Tax=Ambrosiozyma monospora TaxID=43982 RepID=A0A9W6YT45_AMBMO|nr:unnamed protein product [Ambrosiozyma monospora]